MDIFIDMTEDKQFERSENLVDKNEHISVYKEYIGVSNIAKIIFGIHSLSILLVYTKTSVKIHDTA